MRAMAFTSRNIKELLRDPISYVFCLGLPIVMLIVMTLINDSIPVVPGTPKIFNIEKLTPAMTVFALTFIMLFACIRVSGDKSSAFLTRLYASPMKSRDYIIGYTLPFGIIALFQIIITYTSGEIIALINGESFNIINALLSVPLLIPSVILFIGTGIIFGTILNANAAPGVCSAVITAAAILGGIWMDIDAMGGAWKTVCGCLPFYHSVKYARFALEGNFTGMAQPFLICSAFTSVIFVIAVLVFSIKIKTDKR